MRKQGGSGEENADRRRDDGDAEGGGRRERREVGDLLFYLAEELRKEPLSHLERREGDATQASKGV